MRSLEDFAKAGAFLSNWWDFGEQDRPAVVLSAVEDRASVPDTDDLRVHWMDVPFVVERAAALIDSTIYAGEAVPYHYVDFGASAMPCALGCAPRFVDRETIWADPAFDSVEAVLDADPSPAGPFYGAVVEETALSTERAPGHHHVTPFALGAPLDNLSALYGAERMLYDLLDKPELMKRGLARMTDIWIETFAGIQEIIGRSGNPGGVGWAGVWAPGTTFPIQEDIAYMIGPELFGEFCLENIARIAASMEFGFFHLDGTGMLPNLDMLLGIPEIRVIQWVPGAGKERLDQWYPVIRKILGAGRSCQVYGNSEEMDDLTAAVGTRGLLFTCRDPDMSREKVESIAERYGLEVSYPDPV